MDLAISAESPLGAIAAVKIKYLVPVNYWAIVSPELTIVEQFLLKFQNVRNVYSFRLDLVV